MPKGFVDNIERLTKCLIVKSSINRFLHKAHELDGEFVVAFFPSGVDLVTSSRSGTGERQNASHSAGAQ